MVVSFCVWEMLTFLNCIMVENVVIVTESKVSFMQMVGRIRTESVETTKDAKEKSFKNLQGKIKISG